MAADHRISTLADVALAAGVSRATVSRVINSSKHVEPPVADRVRRAVTELGYVPNHAARSLITRRTDMVALVVGEPDVRLFHDPFFASIVRGIAQELGEVDLRLVMSLIQSPDDTSRIERYLSSKPVDGVLVISEHATHQIAPRLVESGVPVVIGGRPFSSDLEVSFVDHENRIGGRLAGEHLLRRGITKPAIIAGPQDMSAGVDRLIGFLDALGRPLPPERVAYGDFTMASGVAGMARLLAMAPEVDGVFAASDLMALGAMQTLWRAGRRVPADVAVVGFDDNDLAEGAVVPLTTVRQDVTLQGRMMVRLLLQKLGRTGDLAKAARDSLSGANSMHLPVRLVVRESA